MKPGSPAELGEPLQRCEGLPLLRCHKVGELVNNNIYVSFGGLLLPGGVLLRYDAGKLDAVIAPTEHALEGRTIYTLDLIPKATAAGEVAVEMDFEAV